MGLGTLGANAALALRHLGFRVCGWSRSAKAIEGVECFHGHAQLDAFLGQTDILVCLLPLTPDTRHILNRGLFAKLNRKSPMGAPVLINAGRGGLQNEADILGCLDDGTLGAVSLDVFAQEPLPAESPFWSHPKVVLTPHNAADTDPDEISKYVARQIARFEAGGALENVVDPARGYYGFDAHHHIDRTFHDRLQFVARRLGARPDRDGVDGRGGELREHYGIGGFGQFAVLSARRKQAANALSSSAKPSSTSLRISGSDTASEAAVITVKQPRGPASPER